MRAGVVSEFSVVSNDEAPASVSQRGPRYLVALAWPPTRFAHLTQDVVSLPSPATTSGEGELHKKRTEGVRLARESKPVSRCDGITPAFMGFLTFRLYGGKGANAPEFTSVHKGLVHT